MPDDVRIDGASLITLEIVTGKTFEAELPKKTASRGSRGRPGRRAEWPRWTSSAGHLRSCPAARPGPRRGDSGMARRWTSLADVVSIVRSWVHLVTGLATSRPRRRARPARRGLWQPVLCRWTASTGSAGSVETVETDSFFITPRIGTTSPWSSKATEIAHVCGLTAITRIRRGTEWNVSGQSIDGAVIGAALSDRMTESVIVRGKISKLIAAATTPRARDRRARRADPATLREASRRLGLALCWTTRSTTSIARYPRARPQVLDVELMMFAQANGEHCRHKIFNAEWFVGDKKQDRSLFDWIKLSTAAAPDGVLSAYKDNAAVIEGHAAAASSSPTPTACTAAITSRRTSSARSRPTIIRPRSRRSPARRPAQAARFRDEGAARRGGKPKAGLVGFTVSDLRIPGALDDQTTASEWNGSPARM